MVVAQSPIGRVAERVGRLADGYEPPSFDHVRNADAAIFLCAIDHRTGYRAAHLVEGKGPLEGSALMWEVALLRARRQSGLLTAASLREVSGEQVAELLRIDGDAVLDPEPRAALWRDLAAGLEREYRGEAEQLLVTTAGRLGGRDGLLARLATFEAYADPLRKKSLLFAKICARRGWLDVQDPEHWAVCADNVLMRLALRSGLVQAGSLAEVRAATLEAFRAVAERAGVSPPVLDDLLWERGRDDPDLLGTEGGDLSEPPRPGSSTWY